MASSTIQQVNSCPDYINTFVQTNIEQLITIYEAGYSNNNQEGCLGLICNQETNKMDVMFLHLQSLSSLITAETWYGIKNNIPEGKRLFLVKDEILNSIFLLYI